MGEILLMIAKVLGPPLLNAGLRALERQKPGVGKAIAGTLSQVNAHPDQDAAAQQLVDHLTNFQPSVAQVPDTVKE